MLDGFIGFLVAATAFWLFWPVVALFFIIVGVFYRDDWVWAGVFWFAVPLVGIYLLFYGLTWPDFSTAMLFIGIYLGVGFGWSLLRWILAVNFWKTEVRRVVAKNDSWSALPKEDKVKKLDDATDRHARAIVSYDDLKKLDINPKLGNNKSRVTRWVCFWPLSLVNYVFDRFLKDLVDAIIEALSGFYDWLAKQIMGDVKV